MTFKEFKGTCYHTRTRLVIPALGSYVEKSRFLVRGKYSIKKQDEHLEELYETYKKKLESI
jgi:hypothetical protein